MLPSDSPTPAAPQAPAVAPVGAPSAEPGSPSPIQRAIAIFVRPAAAWGGLRERSQWWIPMLGVLLVTLVGSVLIYHRAQIPTIMDAMEEKVSSGQMTAEQLYDSLITATQAADDYYSSKQMETAFQFADWVFLMRQKKESIELLGRSGRIVMDDAKKRLLTSLRTEPGVYSEIYIYSPMGEGIGRLILDPHTLLLFSNRHEDNQAIDQRRARGMSIDQAIDEVLRERSGKPS